MKTLKAILAIVVTLCLLMMGTSCSTPQAKRTVILSNDSTDIFEIRYTTRPDTMFAAWPSIEKTGEETAHFFGSSIPVYKATIKYDKEAEQFTVGAVAALQQLLHNIADGDWKEFVIHNHGNYDPEMENYMLGFINEELEKWE
jgi:hypothetical protein